MKTFLPVLAIATVCLFATCEAQKRPPKQVKNLKKLCDRADSGRLSLSDGNYTDVFDDITDWCTDYFLVNLTDFFIFKAEMKKERDDIDVFYKVCKWYKPNKNGDDRDGLEGLGDLCYDFMVVMNATLIEDEPKELPKAYGLLTAMCTRAEKGKLKWRNSTFDDVFDDVIDFCPDYLTEMESLYGDKAKGDKPKYNAIKDLTIICNWFDRKYGDEAPDDGPLVGLDEICVDFALLAGY